MTATSMPTLTEQLKEKKIQDRLAVEKITSEQFGLLKKTLAEAVQRHKQFNHKKYGRTEDARLTKFQVKFWLIPLSLSLLVVPALILGTLWTNHFLDRIHSREGRPR